MGRKGTADSYLALIATIRNRFFAATIRSTFMTGFPGESEEDFAALRAFQDRAEADWAGCFAYSREEDTPAYAMKGRVAKKTAEARKAGIEEAQEAISEKRLERFIG
jgi:ribosomal protein S12 methylthiotransferase